MKIGIPKEIFEDERRVAATPPSVHKLIGLGYDVIVEGGAGEDQRPERRHVAPREAQERRERQLEQSGGPYLMGKELRAPDIFWAAFSNLIQPLPPEASPMPDNETVESQ